MRLGVCQRCAVPVLARTEWRLGRCGRGWMRVDFGERDVGFLCRMFVREVNIRLRFEVRPAGCMCGWLC